MVHTYNPALTRPRKEGSTSLRQAWLQHKMQKGKKKRTQSLKSGLYNGSILLISPLGSRGKRCLRFQASLTKVSYRSRPCLKGPKILCCLQYLCIKQLIPRVPGKQKIVRNMPTLSKQRVLSPLEPILLPSSTVPFQYSGQISAPPSLRVFPPRPCCCCCLCQTGSHCVEIVSHFQNDWQMVFLIFDWQEMKTQKVIPKIS